MAEYLAHMTEDRFLNEGEDPAESLIRIFWRLDGERGGAMACEVSAPPLAADLVRFVEMILGDDAFAQVTSFAEVSQHVAAWLLHNRQPGQYARVVSCYDGGCSLSEVAFYGKCRTYTFTVRKAQSDDVLDEDV